MRNRYKTEAEKRADYLGYQRGYHAGIKKSVRHGRWVRKKNIVEQEITVCSVCGEMKRQATGNYCGMCGAKMDEGEE